VTVNRVRGPPTAGVTRTAAVDRETGAECVLTVLVLEHAGAVASDSGANQSMDLPRMAQV
jgi:hypothetical protein